MSNIFKISTLRTSTRGLKLSVLLLLANLSLDLGALTFESCWIDVAGDETPDSDLPEYFEQGTFGESGLYQITSYEISDSKIEAPTTPSPIVSDKLAKYQNELRSRIEEGSIRLVVDPATQIPTHPILSKARILILFTTPPFGYNQEHLFYFLKEENRILSIEVILDHSLCRCGEHIDEAVEWKIGELLENENP